MALAAFILTAGIVLAVRDAIGASQHLLADVVPGLLLAGLAAHAVTLAVNAHRLGVSLEISGAVSRRLNLIGLIDLMVLHNFLVSFLPARLGDGYYPFLVARRAGVSVGVGVGNLVLIRVFDVLAITVILSALAPVALGAAQLEQLYLVVVPLLIVLAIASARLDLLLAVFLRMTVRLLKRTAWSKRIFRVINQARRWIGNLNTRQRVVMALHSLAPWAASGFTYFFIIQAVGMDMTWAQSMFAGKFAELGAAIPIQAAGGIGAGEGLLATVLVGFGVPIGIAVIGALSVRVVILGIVVALFVVRAVLLMLFVSPQRRNRSIFAVLFSPDGIAN